MVKCSVMFIREKRRRNKNGSVVTYLQLVENRRVEGKTRQRVLCTLGRVDDPTLPSRLKGLVETASRYVRPEDVAVSLEGGDFPARVFVVEPQGPQQILSFKLDEALILKSLASADLPVSPGQQVWLSFNRDRLHLFDRDSGVRIN